MSDKYNRYQDQLTRADSILQLGTCKPGAKDLLPRHKAEAGEVLGIVYLFPLLQAGGAARGEACLEGPAGVDKPQGKIEVPKS